MSPLVPLSDLLTRDDKCYAWRDSPRPVAMDHYEAAIADLLRRAQRFPAIAGAYDLGPIRFPGLSDIDILFAVDDSAADIDLSSLKREALPPDFHNVVLHDPYFVRVSELPHIFKFTPILTLRERWTRRPLAGPGENNDTTNLTLTLLDTIAECYPHEFIRFLARDTLDERELVGRLKGLGYCIDLQQRFIRDPDPGEKQFAAEVEQLRHRFFELDPIDRRAQVLSLTRRAVHVSLNLASATSRALAEQWGASFQGSCLLAATRVPACWSDELPAPPRAGIVKLRQLDAFGQAPLLYGWLALEYAKADGPISGHIAARLIDKLRIQGAPPDFIRTAIANRIALRNDHAAWIDRLGQGFYAFNAFGYAAREPFTPRAMARSLLDRLRERQLRRLMLQLTT